MLDDPLGLTIEDASSEARPAGLHSGRPRRGGEGDRAGSIASLEELAQRKDTAGIREVDSRRLTALRAGGSSGDAR